MPHAKRAQCGSRIAFSRIIRLTRRPTDDLIKLSLPIPIVKHFALISCDCLQRPPRVALVFQLLARLKTSSPMIFRKGGQPFLRRSKPCSLAATYARFMPDASPFLKVFERSGSFKYMFVSHNGLICSISDSVPGIPWSLKWSKSCSQFWWTLPPKCFRRLQPLPLRYQLCFISSSKRTKRASSLTSVPTNRTKIAWSLGESSFLQSLTFNSHLRLSPVTKTNERVRSGGRPRSGPMARLDAYFTSPPALQLKSNAFPNILWTTDSAIPLSSRALYKSNTVLLPSILSPTLLQRSWGHTSTRLSSSWLTRHGFQRSVNIKFFSSSLNGRRCSSPLSKNSIFH